MQSIISIATRIYKFICFLISYACVWLRWSSGSDQLAIFFSDSIYECGGPFRWPWGAGMGGAAEEWYETQKFVLNCSMYLELVKYLVWICLDTEWPLKGLNVNEIWKAWNLGSRTHNQMCSTTLNQVLKKTPFLAWSDCLPSNLTGTYSLTAMTWNAHFLSFQKSKGTQMACTNLPQKAFLCFEVYCLNVCTM